MTNTQSQDPMDFVRNMWGGMGFSLPGMVTPTFDVDELEKRVTDLKAVEGWLRMNLSMLQMTIQGLEMQKATLSAVHAMGKMGEQGENTGASSSQEQGPTVGEAISQAALWPWNLMQQMQDQLQQDAEAAPKEATPKKPAAATKAKTASAPPKKPRKSAT